MPKLNDIAASVSDAELEILRVLWDTSPLSAQDLIERLEAEQPVSTHPKTVKTLINRLLKKGAVGFHEKNRKYYYYPMLDRDSFYAHKAERFIDKFFGGEVTPLLSFFSQRKKLNDKDRAELKRLLQDLEADDER
jgi:BlaI family penicillinase repressor